MSDPETTAPAYVDAYAAAVTRVPLEAPWDAFWIDVLEPEMGTWIDLSEAWEVAAATKTVEAIDEVLAIVARVVVAHNLVRRDGTPLELKVLQLTSSQMKAIVNAINSVGGGSASPLPRATSPGRSGSTRRRSRRRS